MKLSIVPTLGLALLFSSVAQALPLTIGACIGAGIGTTGSGITIDGSVGPVVGSCSAGVLPAGTAGVEFDVQGTADSTLGVEFAWTGGSDLNQYVLNGAFQHIVELFSPLGELTIGISWEGPFVAVQGFSPTAFPGTAGASLTNIVTVQSRVSEPASIALLVLGGLTAIVMTRRRG